jgi:hypothetical protein
VRLPWPGWMRDWVIGMSERSNPGIWGGLLCTKRFIDEMLVASRNEIQAQVNLGAGFDTRPYRLPALSRSPVWEVDPSENVKAKEKRLRRKAWDDSRECPERHSGSRLAFTYVRKDFSARAGLAIVTTSENLRNPIRIRSIRGHKRDRSLLWEAHGRLRVTAGSAWSARYRRHQREACIFAQSSARVLICTGRSAAVVAVVLSLVLFWERNSLSSIGLRPVNRNVYCLRLGASSIASRHLAAYRNKAAANPAP